MHVLVIYNPVAGGGSAAAVTDRLLPLLAHHQIDVEAVATDGPGAARRRAEQGVAGLDAVVTVGGDGTVNEVLNGLEDPAAVPLVPFSCGTANMLARELKLPDTAEAFVEVLRTGQSQLLDMGVIEPAEPVAGAPAPRRFLLVASSGFDAEVVEYLRDHRGKRLGFLGYAWPIFHRLRHYRPPNLSVRLDGGEPVPGQFLILGNTRYYGGIFRITHRANPQSGHFDLALFPYANRRRLLCVGILGLLHLLPWYGGVRVLTGRELVLTADEPTPVEIDGEHWGNTPVRIHWHPRSVRVLVPAQS